MTAPDCFCAEQRSPSSAMYWALNSQNLLGGQLILADGLELCQEAELTTSLLACAAGRGSRGRLPTPSLLSWLSTNQAFTRLSPRAPSFPPPALHQAPCPTDRTQGQAEQLRSVTVPLLETLRGKDPGPARARPGPGARRWNPAGGPGTRRYPGSI